MSSSGSASSNMILDPAPGYPRLPGPVALVIMDGVGLAPATEWNAFACARTPYLDSLLAGSKVESLGEDVSLLVGELDASGMSVGLPSMSDMGNSEVGHNAMGAGRVYSQGAKLVNEACKTGSFRDGEVWKWLVEQCREEGSGTLHLLGLYSDGNVHAHVNHVFSLLDAAVDDGVKRIRLHVLADGRDVADRSVLEYVGPLEKRLENIRAARGVDIRIASGGGRMVTTMDRYESNWSVVKSGWTAHVLGDTKSLDTFKSYSEAVQHYYDSDPKMVDQYLPPFVITDSDGKDPLGPIHDNDSVLFWNFRGDRALEISRAFEAPEGKFNFDRVRVPKVRYAGIMQYDGEAGIPKRFVVSPPYITRTVGEYAVKNGRTRLSISESQKYGHVTYFYNGNRAAKFDQEKEMYIDIPSYKRRENTRPWMRCAEITDETIKQIEEFKPDLLVLNYANGDMVGHTGDNRASRIAMECIDLCLTRLVPAIIRAGGVLVLTADHGNCEIMAHVDKKTGKPKPGSSPEGWKAMTSHTTQKVPLVLAGKGIDKYEFNKDARWADAEESKGPGIVNLGATVLNLLGLKEPEDYLPSAIKLRRKA